LAIKKSTEMITATTHPMIPISDFHIHTFSMSAALEILSEHLDQEIGYNVRKDDSRIPPADPMRH